MQGEGPKYGRRAQGETNEGADGAPKPVVRGWGEETLTTEDTFVPSPTGGDPVDLPTLDAGVDESAHNRKEEDDALAKEVAAAPVEYHSAMPKLSELDLGLKWAKIHAKCSEEFDMACLTDVLCQQLDDDDVPWQPDMLLVQLTSELLDAVERRDVDGITSSGGAAAAGGMGSAIGSVEGGAPAASPVGTLGGNVVLNSSESTGLLRKRGSIKA